MSRQSFTRAVTVEIAKRSMRPDGQMACERCGSVGVRLELHHKRMDAMVSDADKKQRKLTALDGEMICQECHAPETRQQRKQLAKALAQEAFHLNAKPKPDKPIKSRGFEKSERKHAERQSLPPRQLYR